MAPETSFHLFLFIGFSLDQIKSTQTLCAHKENKRKFPNLLSLTVS